MHPYRLLLAAAALCVAGAASAKNPYPYAPGSCGGLKRLNLTTPAGFCVGLVADRLRFPRGVLPLENGDILVADMGNWDKNQGSLWRLSPRRSATGVEYGKTELLKHLDRPNGLALGPDGKVYVGTATKIFRFAPDKPTLTEDVVGGSSGLVGFEGTGRHPLLKMVFGQDGAMYVNVGSKTDHCEKPNHAKPDARAACPETLQAAPRGAIRRYAFAWPQGKITAVDLQYATGLRNSMALAVHPRTGVLWQGENSRDNIGSADAKLNDETLPHDEINRIVKGGRYGWPYCFDNNRAAPEYPAYRCSVFRQPEVLLPAHAAPLGMLFYTGSRFPAAWRGQLIIGFHGYRAQGHKLMAYAVDGNGNVTSRATPLISGWNNPLGAPTDIAQAPDGGLIISEDRNGTILKLDYPH